VLNCKPIELKHKIIAFSSYCIVIQSTTESILQKSFKSSANMRNLELGLMVFKPLTNNENNKG
jgi:hypothetical protein